MTSIPLRSQTIQDYMGGGRFNSCNEISQIHVVFNSITNKAEVEARIPGSSTRSDYTISVRLSPNGSRILGTDCTCPIGNRCKHVNKVLRRIFHSSHGHLIPGPSRRHSERQARRELASNQMERGAAVYIAFSCKSEMDSGSDYRQSRYVKDKFDEEILGVFFSKRKANRCARDYALSIGCDDDDDDDDDDEEEEEEEEEEFVLNSCDYDVYDDDGYYYKVWVECKGIEDASIQFHR